MSLVEQGTSLATALGLMLAVWWMVRQYLRQAVYSKHVARKLLPQFYLHLDHMLDTPEPLPPRVVGFMQFMVRTVGDGTLVRVTLAHTLGIWRNPRTPRAQRLLFEGLTEEQQKHLFKALMLYSLIDSYRNPALGALWRRVYGWVKIVNKQAHSTDDSGALAATQLFGNFIDSRPALAG